MTSYMLFANLKIQTSNQLIYVMIKRVHRGSFSMPRHRAETMINFNEIYKIDKALTKVAALAGKAYKL